MYYYIFDIKKCKKRSQVEAIKNQLIELGISGEYTYISSAQNAEELALLGLKRGYSTIIVAGADDSINAVANVLVGQSQAMGIIPLQASKALCHLIGTSSVTEAVESLRFRRINEIITGRTAGGQHFLTYLEMDLSSPMEFTVEFKNYIVQAHVKNMIISNYHPEIRKMSDDYLDTVIESSAPNHKGLIGTIKNLFGGKADSDDKHLSIFRSRSLRIFTKKPISIQSGDAVIAKTPQLIETSEQTLRIIVTKGKGA
jgi:diacylglycerol kinase family enzyme